MKSRGRWIRRYGSKCLRRTARQATPGHAQTAELLDGLWAVLADDGGVGLAAPQVGIGRRVIVIRDPNLPAGQQRLDLVNPEITRTLGPEVSFEEGCLSFPGLYLRVVRPRGIEVLYCDRAGEQRRLRDEGLVARIIQHEMDHLDGLLFIDHLPRWRRLMLGPRLWLIGLGNILPRNRGNG